MKIMNDSKLEEPPEHTELELRLIAAGFTQNKTHGHVWDKAPYQANTHNKAHCEALLRMLSPTLSQTTP